VPFRGILPSADPSRVVPPPYDLRFVRWYGCINSERRHKHTDPNLSSENEPVRRISQPVNIHHMEPTARSIARTYSIASTPTRGRRSRTTNACRRTPLNTQTRGGRPWGTRSNCRPPASVAGSTAANPIRCAGFRRRARTAGSNPTAIWPVRWLSCSRTSSQVEASTRRLSPQSRPGGGSTTRRSRRRSRRSASKPTSDTPIATDARPNCIRRRTHRSSAGVWSRWAPRTA